MKALLYKEFKLATHPAVYFFLLLSTLLLIPSYIYHVAFIYTLLGVFLIFLTGRENKDILATVSLPVRKRDLVKARISMVTIIELLQIVISIPFAIIGVRINPLAAGNTAGIEANYALFGSVLVMYAIFNLLFIPAVYSNPNKVGIPFLVSGLVVLVYGTAFEALVQLVPTFKAALDNTNPAHTPAQLMVLAFGIVFFVLTLWLTYKCSVENFEKVDL